MSAPPDPLSAAPGTLTSLLDEVFRGASSSRASRDAWVDGLSAGTALGRYDLIREVGRGGFGVVWEARDRELGRRVAVKVIRAPRGDAPAKRVLAEAEVAARLSHPGIVTTLDVGRNEHGAWLVQEFLSGETLAAGLERGPMALREVLRVGLAVARALAHAHAHGVVHRDLTARNVFLCDDGQVKLLDLGIAQAFGRRRLAGGSPDGMAPEQAAGAPEDERTDVYALGALLYLLLTGEPPVRPGGGATGPRGLGVAEAPALAALVESMLARDPLERPRDAGAAVEALERIEADLPRSTAATTGTAGAPGRVRAPARIRWLVAGAVGGALVAGTTVALWLATRRDPPASLVVAASSALTACRWEEVLYANMEDAPPGSVVRGGKSGKQEPTRKDGRLVWRQGADWNNLFIPMKELPDVFAVEAQVLVPEATNGLRSAGITVFTDPDGPDPGHALHGRSLSLVDEPGRAPFFQWGFRGGPERNVTAKSGPLSRAFAGRWLKLRVEGSRSGCWVRALVDDVPVVFETGACDLGGHHLLLQANAPFWKSADVDWKDLQVFKGNSNCQ
jgi:hypothetical protein